jgi:hypothetical protein
VYWIDGGVALVDVLHLAFGRSAVRGNDVCGDCTVELSHFHEDEMRRKGSAMTMEEKKSHRKSTNSSVGLRRSKGSKTWNL